MKSDGGDGYEIKDDDDISVISNNENSYSDCDGEVEQSERG